MFGRLSLQPQQTSGFLFHTYILRSDNTYITSGAYKLRVSEKKDCPFKSNGTLFTVTKINWSNPTFSRTTGLLCTCSEYKKGSCNKKDLSVAVPI